VLEGRGIVTCSVTALPEITTRVAPPRTLAVPYPLGYPLGAPSDGPLQRRIIEAALALCEGEPSTEPVPFVK
jgi:D-proline reductase (dithiol) PrdB